MSFITQRIKTILFDAIERFYIIRAISKKDLGVPRGVGGHDGHAPPQSVMMRPVLCNFFQKILGGRGLGPGPHPFLV